VRELNFARDFANQMMLNTPLRVHPVLTSSTLNNLESGGKVLWEEIAFVADVDVIFACACKSAQINSRFFRTSLISACDIPRKFRCLPSLVASLSDISDVPLNHTCEL